MARPAEAKQRKHTRASTPHTRPCLDAEVAGYISAGKDEGRVRPAEAARRRERHAQVPPGRLRDERHARRRGQRRREVRRRRRRRREGRGTFDWLVDGARRASRWPVAPFVDATSASSPRRPSSKLERRELGRVAGGRAGRVRAFTWSTSAGSRPASPSARARGAQDAGAVRRRRRRVHGVAAEAVAAQLRVGARAPARRALRVLEDEHGGALAEHEAAPRGVEGPRGAVAREGAHAREAPQRDLVDARLGAAAEGDVAVPALDEAERVAHGLRPGGARRGRRLHGARAGVLEGHGAGRRVAERARHEERRELLAFGDAVRRVDDVAQPADARRDRRARRAGAWASRPPASRTASAAARSASATTRAFSRFSSSARSPQRAATNDAPSMSNCAAADSPRCARRQLSAAVPPRATRSRAPSRRRAAGAGGGAVGAALLVVFALLRREAERLGLMQKSF